MLASVFSKTKPINYIILTVLLVFAYVIYQLTTIEVQQITLLESTEYTIELVLLLLMMYLSQFIVSRNRLVRDHAFVPLLFVSFILFFPSLLTSAKLIVSNYFIMLALRRIFSLHSLKQSKEKIFDASLWILMASLFHFWSILFLILLFVALISFVQKDFRNWIIPLLAFLTVFIGICLYLQITNIPLQQWLDGRFDMSLNFLYFDDVFANIALAVFASISVLFFTSETLSLGQKAYNMQNMYKKILLTFVIGVAVYIISPEKSNAILLFSFFPLSILGANYLDNIPQKWQQEAVVYSVFILGLFFFIAQVLL
ncbi:DUF6427 family protein [Myroides sp. LJL116]